MYDFSNQQNMLCFVYGLIVGNMLFNNLPFIFEVVFLGCIFLVLRCSLCGIEVAKFLFWYPYLFFGIDILHSALRH